ncbi:hypothetical protein ACMD2_20380 [Ananas comosus]|uniref:Uncharacterized protein n=1 Tax=Ananas comosus TaxID=4615 RepID=A0A199VUI6_ANACO|nr:hypothetical protein ACMD2_20380 [Ananas comosus]
MWSTRPIVDRAQLASISPDTFSLFLFHLSSGETTSAAADLAPGAGQGWEGSAADIRVLL